MINKAVVGGGEGIPDAFLLQTLAKKFSKVLTGYQLISLLTYLGDLRSP
jgi:hypothetical protein